MSRESVFRKYCSVILAQDSNATLKVLSWAGAERLAYVVWKGFGSFYKLHDRVVLGFTRKFWFIIILVYLLFKESQFCISKVLVLDIFLQIDMRLTTWLHALWYLFYLP